MILETVINIFCVMLDGLLSGLELVQIPKQGIEALATVTAYGSYVVGADLPSSLFYSISVFQDKLHRLIYRG